MQSESYGYCASQVTFWGGLAPVVFVALVAAALLGQLLLEAVTPRSGAATIVQPGRCGG